MASYIPCVKNDAGGLVFYVGLVSQADTKIFKTSPTLAAGDVQIALDDGAPANLGTLPVFDADFTKRVKVTLSQAEINADNLTIVFTDAAGAEWCDLIINIQTAAQTFDTMDTNIDDIETDTAVIGALGAGLTALATQASVNTIDDFLDTEIAAIKAKTDLLPSGVEKNVALSNFPFLMVLASDHITPATGKTITAQISADGAAFAGCTNAVAEVGSGIYKISLTQAEMNADTIVLKFTETDCDARIITVITST